MKAFDSKWGGAERIGTIYEVQLCDFTCVGHCWMKGRLLEGDLVMATTLSGDGFFTFALLDHGWTFGDGKFKDQAGYRLIEESKFGAYGMSKPYKLQPTAREFHLLMAGESTPLTAKP